MLSRISDRAAGYIGVSYYPRPGFGIGPSVPSIIPLDPMNVAGAAPVQVLNIIGTNPVSQLEGRWLLASLGNDVTIDFTELLTAATTAACERIIPLLEAAGPEKGFRYIYNPARWSVDTGTQPPPDPTLDQVAWLIRATSLDEAAAQDPAARDWLRQEVMGQTTTYDRLHLASFGDADVLAELERTVRAMVRPTAVPQIPDPPTTFFEAVPGTEIRAATWTAFLMALHTIEVDQPVPRHPCGRLPGSRRGVLRFLGRPDHARDHPPQHLRGLGWRRVDPAAADVLADRLRGRDPDQRRHLGRLRRPEPRS